MVIKPGDPLYWLVSLALVVILLGGNYFYVTFFIKQIEPAAKAATETRLDVDIESSIRGFWTVQPESLKDFHGNRHLLKVKVFALNFTLLMLFVAGFLLEILLFYFIVARLFRGST